MKKFGLFLLVLFSMLKTATSNAQKYTAEVGIGLGNVVGTEHSLGKAELHLNVLKSFSFGQLGIDLVTGGNFIPGERSIQNEATQEEILSPNDTKFDAVTFIYRTTIYKSFYLEPRIGYVSLYSRTNADNADSRQRSNLTVGLSLGIQLERFLLSLRYQYFGKTADYLDTQINTTIIGTASPVDMVFLRASYQFDLDSLFKPKNKEE
ncbi:MAG: hypothetical protein ACWA5P_03110 [bacterium]